MKLEVAMLVGAESKAFLQGLTEQLDRMEKLAEQIRVSPAVATAAITVTEDEEVDETPAPKAKRGRPAKVKAAVVDDDDFEDEEEAEEEADDEIEDEEIEDEDEEEAPAPVKAKAKAKKLTIDDVNDACKAFARENGGGKTGRDAVLKILKKNFKVTSLTEIAPGDYAKVIQLMAV